MNSPTCQKCDCVAGCQASTEVCPNVAQPEQLAPPLWFVQKVPDHCDRITWRDRYYHLPIAQPEQPAQESMDAKNAGYFYNLVRYALMDVGAAHGGCKHRLEDICKELEALMHPAIAQPKDKPAVPTAVAQYGRCSDTLRNLGKAYPRTCAECGLGPCKTKPAQPKDKP